MHEETESDLIVLSEPLANVLNNTITWLVFVANKTHTLIYADYRSAKTKKKSHIINS